MASLTSRYDGPPTCLRKTTWKTAPFCDGCGMTVTFRIWKDNKRHCSPACRPAWHLLDRVVCKMPGCDIEVSLPTHRGRPPEFCSDDCRRDADAERKRRLKLGLPSIDKEVRGDPALRAEWMPQITAWELDPDSSGFIELDEDGNPVDKDWLIKGQSLRSWLLRGGDWPNMRPAGLPCGTAAHPTMGDWLPWDDPRDGRRMKP